MTHGEHWSTLLHYAAMAPSSHNTQPWQFRIHERTAELRADRSRSLPVVDPSGRELVISCGAALLTLRVAIDHFGMGERTLILPERADPDLLARIELLNHVGAATGDDALFDAIAERRTNRFPFKPDPVASGIIDELQQAARREGARLEPLRADADRRRVADLIGEGDLLQAADPEMRREMAEWVRSNNSSRRDGLRGYSFGHARFASLLAALYVRYADWGEAQAAADRSLALTAPVLAVLGTDGDAPSDWMRGGQALGRVLLVAQRRRVSASFLNQPVQVPQLRTQLQGIAPAIGVAQICLRFGYGPKALPTPRRLVEEIVEARSPAPSAQQQLPA